MIPREESVTKECTVSGTDTVRISQRFFGRASTVQYVEDGVWDERLLLRKPLLWHTARNEYHEWEN